MIEKMTKYSFILLKGEQDDFLARLQSLGVVDITRSTKPIDDSSSQMLAWGEDCKKAISILENTDFGKDPDAGELEKIYTPTVEDSVYETLEVSHQLSELKNSFAQAERLMKETKIWGHFDRKAFSDLENRGFKIRFYVVSKNRFNSEWEYEYPLQIANEENSKVYFVTISDSEEYSFPIKEVQAPQFTLSECQDKLEEIRAEILTCKSKLLKLKGFTEEMKKEYETSVQNLDLYLAKQSSEAVAESHVSVFEGFAPSTEDERLKTVFDSMDIIYLKDSAIVDDNPPIKLKNNWFTGMFSILTDMYGRPGYDGFDPTPFLSVFFLLFFGFCMGDAGYGIILIIIGLLLRKVKAATEMAPLVVTLGIGTVLIGYIFHTFFSMDMLQWSFLPEWSKTIMVPSKIGMYDGAMIVAVIVGIVHLSLAMIVKTYNSTKNNGFLNSLGTWGWTLFLVGSAVLGGLAAFGVLAGEALKWSFIVLGSISAIGIFLLNNLKRNPLLNIGAGLWDTYNTATGLLGDVLSYLRLYALGLAGSMLGYAFNNIGKMILGDGSSAFSWVFCILIIILGHTMNLALASLGAFVHPIRLNFLEFFKNAGYEATGRNYNPIKK